jgi:hypothetical protein
MVPKISQKDETLRSVGHVATSRRAAHLGAGPLEPFHERVEDRVGRGLARALSGRPQRQRHQERERVLQPVLVQRLALADQ